MTLSRQLFRLAPTTGRPAEGDFLSVSLLFILQLVVPLVAPAQTLQLSPSSMSSTIAHSFSSGAVSDSQGLTFPELAIHLKDYNTIQVTVTAPAGQAWFVHSANPGAQQQDLPQLGLGLTYVTAGQAMGAPWAQVTSASLDVGFVVGGPAPLSSPSFLSFIPDSGNSFSVGASAQVNGNFAFTNITLTVSFDNSALVAATPEAFLSARLVVSCGDLTSDPGPELTLRPVPTPLPLRWQPVLFSDGSRALVFEWANSSFALQAASTPTGVYTNIPGATSPYAVSLGAPQLFFRLQVNP